ncbi:MAG: FKBP-type peptidyl-prolyl isomerase [Linnemannia gamsii]|nr:MAG: FKBP-type peptidyl-prolyl isomerase [Linnemannia gamsii]
MGVIKTTLTPGNGADFPKPGDTVTMHYVGTLADGTKFDSSRDRNKEFVTQIGVGRVIKGWDEGVPQMSLGEKAVLKISSDYGYGARGYPPIIPQNAELTFEVELFKINDKSSV